MFISSKPLGQRLKGLSGAGGVINSEVRSDAEIYSDSARLGGANVLFFLTLQGYVWIAQLSARKRFIRIHD